MINRPGPADSRHQAHALTYLPSDQDLPSGRSRTATQRPSEILPEPSGVPDSSFSSWAWNHAA